MKNFLTILILLAFCTIQTTWAKDIIIVGSDGQAETKSEQCQDCNEFMSETGSSKKENKMSKSN